MIEEHENIQTDDGIMPTFTCWPNDKGTYPAIVFYMDAPGIREELYDMVRRIASDGYYVILPDLFYRFGCIRFPERNQYSQAVWNAIMKELSNAMVMNDTRALLAHMDSHSAVRKGPKATIGYCMSGRIVTTAAGTFPDVFVANASLYGVGIVTAKDDSPHFMIKKIKGEMYFGFAETDSTVPSYVIPTLQNELDTYDINHILEIHPGTKHGFCFPSRDIYVESAAEKVHAHFMGMCSRHLT